MTVETIINQAFRPDLGVFYRDSMYVVEANSERNTLRVLSLKTAYEYGFICFKYGINSGNTILGVFNTEDAAEEFILSVRSLIREENGNLP